VTGSKEIIAFSLEKKIIDSNDKILLIASSRDDAQRPLNYPNLFEYIEVVNYLDK